MRSYKIIVVVVLAIVFMACKTANEPLSPTETMKALNEATKTKDVERIKKLVSKGTLDLLEYSAKNQNMSVDELLRQDKGAPFQELPETRNEKITGDTATVEIKNTAGNGWETMPFVKEDGVWKIALDKFMDDIMKRARDVMNQPPPPGSDETKQPVSNSAVNK